MVGQMLAFDKVWPLFTFSHTCPSTNNTAAHEPRPRRHRRVPPHTTKGKGRARRNPAGHRDRGATRHWTYYHSWRARHLAVRRWTTARRPCRTTWRSLWWTFDSCDSGCWTWCGAPCRTWAASWSDWTCSWCRRAGRWFRRTSRLRWPARLWRTTRLWRTWRTPRWTTYVARIIWIRRDIANM